MNPTKTCVCGKSCIPHNCSVTCDGCAENYCELCGLPLPTKVESANDVNAEGKDYDINTYHG